MLHSGLGAHLRSWSHLLSVRLRPPACLVSMPCQSMDESASGEASGCRRAFACGPSDARESPVKQVLHHRKQWGRVQKYCSAGSFHRHSMTWIKPFLQPSGQMMRGWCWWCFHPNPKFVCPSNPNTRMEEVRIQSASVSSKKVERSCLSLHCFKGWKSCCHRSHTPHHLVAGGHFLNLLFTSPTHKHFADKKENKQTKNWTGNSRNTNTATDTWEVHNLLPQPSANELNQLSVTLLKFKLSWLLLIHHQNFGH